MLQDTLKTPLRLLLPFKSEPLFFGLHFWLNSCGHYLRYSLNRSFSRYGRKGQKQYGIDIYCDADNGKRLVAQCKNYLSSKADELNMQIGKDIEAAKERFDIDTFIIMTAHERDTAVQDFVSKLKDKYTFNLELWFWEDIQEKIIESNELLRRYYPSYIIKPDKPEKDMLVTLLSEARGKCLSCGRELGIPVRGKLPSSNCEIVYITFSDSDTNSYENAVALCLDKCFTEFALMSDEEKIDLLESKRRCAEIQAFLEKIHGIKFQKEIETVLREIHKIKNDGKLEKVDLKDLVDIKQKIHELYLKEKIDASMVRLYNPVKRICGRLEQEIGFDTQNFGELMKSIQIILTSDVVKNSEISDPQEYVIKLLVENLSSQVGQRHADACEIIIGYLVKRCDLFNENAKQS